MSNNLKEMIRQHSKLTFAIILVLNKHYAQFQQYGLHTEQLFMLRCNDESMLEVWGAAVKFRSSIADTSISNPDLLLN